MAFRVTNSIMNYKTSCSDNDFYPAFCESAYQDDNVFTIFRSHPIYRNVVETLSYEAGLDYFYNILSHSKELTTYFKEFQNNDTIGNPSIFSYRYGFLKLKKINFAPTTLRYIKVLADLKTLFGSLDNMRIIEIGGGYGGQCSIISKVFKPASYTIVDLEPCARLANKYLESLNVNGVNYIYSNKLDMLQVDKGFDLVISNYAFSELSRPLQDEYVSRIISVASKGYFICNFSTHTWDVRQYSEYEFARLHKDSVVYKNYPPLADIDIHHNICLVVFGAEPITGWKPNFLCLNS